MATLSDINKTLGNQGDILEQVGENTKKTSQAINRFMEYMEGKRLQGDKLEEAREDVKEKSGPGILKRGATAVKNKVSGIADSFQFPTGLLTGAGLTTLATGLSTGLLRRGVPAAIGLTFADEIGNWVTSQTGKEELGKAAERATIGGSFGLLLGKKFGLIGVAIGALATDENQKLMTDIGQSLKTNWDEAAKKLEPIIGFLPTVDNIFKFLSDTTTSGLKGIKGFLDSGFDSEEFKNNWGSAVGLLGSVAFLLAPGKFTKALTGITKFAARKPKLIALLAAMAAGTFVYDKLFGDGELGVDDVAVGAAGAGAAALGYKAIKGAGSRSAPSAAQIAEQRGSMARMGAPKVLGTLNGKNVVKSAGGNFAIAGADGKATAQILNEADLKKMKPTGSGAKWWNKFPRIKALRSIPGSALLFAALDGAVAAGIMNDDTLSMEDKIRLLGPLIGSTLGTIGFGALGGAIGTAAFPGAGTLVGGTLGALAGMFGGEWAGEQVAALLLGKDPKELHEASKKYIESTIPKGPAGYASDMAGEAGGFESLPPKKIQRPSANSGVEAGANQLNDYQRYMGGASAAGLTVGNSINSGNTNISNNTAPPAAGNSPIDHNDMLWNTGA